VIQPAIPFLSRLAPAEGSGSASWLPVGVLVAMATACALAAWSWFRVTTRPSNRLRKALLATTFTTLSLAIGLGDAWAFAYNSRFAFYYPFRDFIVGWLQFDVRCGPSGARVAYAGTNIPYFLFGVGLRNDVRYVNVDHHRTWLLDDYHRDATTRGQGIWPNPRPGWDRAAPSYDAWVDNLLADQIQILVVTRVNTGEGAHNVADSAGFPIERQWAESHPDRFEPLYGVREQDPQFRVYRVLRTKTTAS
jgi:hypothetical protein